MPWTSPTVRDLFTEGDAIKGSNATNSLGKSNLWPSVLGYLRTLMLTEITAAPTSSVRPTSAGQKTPIAAIACGVVAGVLVVAALATIVLVRRRNQRKIRETNGGGSAAFVPHAELSGESKVLEMPVGEEGVRKSRAEMHELSS